MESEDMSSFAFELKIILILFTDWLYKKNRGHTVNFLKFRKLYSILFLSKFCFYSCFLSYLVKWQTE